MFPKPLLLPVLQTCSTPLAGFPLAGHEAVGHVEEPRPAECLTFNFQRDCRRATYACIECELPRRTNSETTWIGAANTSSGNAKTHSDRDDGRCLDFGS